MTMTKGSLSGRMLLVDDLVDSGVTLEQVQSHLRTNFPAVTEVRSAVIWCKACSSVRPDFYLAVPAASIRGSTSRSRNTTACVRTSWRRG